MKGSLTNRIAGIAVGVSLTAILVVGGASYTVMQGRLDRDQDEIVQLAASAAALELSSRLSGYSAALHDLASSGVLQSGGTDSNTLLLRRFAATMDLHGSLMLLDRSGELNAATGSDSLQHGEFSWLSQVGEIRRPRAAIENLRQSGWSIVMAEPLMASAGQSQGVVALTLPIGELFKQLSLPLPRQARLQMIRGGEPNGWSLSNAAYLQSPRNDVLTRPLQLPDALSPLRLQIHAEAQNDVQGHPLRQLTLILLGIGVVILAIAVEASLLLSRWIVAPLRRLKKSAVEFDVESRQPFPQDPAWSRQDEIGQLASSLQGMAQRLAQSYDELEQRGASLMRNAESIGGMASWRWISGEHSMRWSERVYSLLDLPAASPGTLDRLISRLHSEDRPRLVLAMKDLTERGHSFDLECRVLVESGPVRLIRMIGKIGPETGHRTAYDGVMQDITAQRAAENALQASKARFEAILRNTPIGIALLNAERVILEANRAFLDIFGVEADTLIGHHSRVVYGSEEQYEDLGRRAYPMVMAGGTFSDDMLMLRPDGKGVWTRLTGRLIDPEHPELGSIWAGEDISERIKSEETQRKREAALAQAHAELERKATELERSNAELEQFAYVASHDLRQPLRMVVSYLTLLERQYGAALTGDGVEFLQFARGGAERMDRLIIDLLDYSRIGRHGSEMTPLSLVEMLGEAVENLTVAVQESGGRIDTDLPEDLPLLQGYRQELVRLLQNLLANALKYHAPEVLPVVTVSARHADGLIRISVSDNGIGIAPENFERIFGIFQRLHGRDEYEGTGIGLAVCKKIVQHHRGQISVTSAPGRGTSFQLELPAA